MASDRERAVVLGGAGFVGRHVCAAFAASGSEVLAIGRTSPPPSWPHRFARVDVSSVPVQTLAATLDAERPWVVVNGVGSIWNKTADQMWPATTAAQQLLDAFSLLSCRPRLVHLGSVLEYAAERAGGGRSVTSVYGAAKRAATQAVLDAAAAGRVDAMVLRIANVAGPGTPDVSLLGRVAQTLVRAREQGGTAVIEVDVLRARRDYVDVRDVADAVLAAASAPALGTVVDIGTGVALPVRSLVDLLVAASGVSARLVERNPPSTAGGMDLIRVDPEPARELLGWHPRRSAADAVRAYWADVSRPSRARR